MGEISNFGKCAKICFQCNIAWKEILKRVHKSHFLHLFWTNRTSSRLLATKIQFLASLKNIQKPIIHCQSESKCMNLSGFTSKNAVLGHYWYSLSFVIGENLSFPQYLKVHSAGDTLRICWYFLLFEVFINWITTPKSQKIHYFSTSLMRFASKTFLEILFRNLKNIHLPLIMCHQNHKFSSKIIKKNRYFQNANASVSRFEKTQISNYQF